MEQPDKFIKINGVRQLNPAYTEWQRRNNVQETTLLYPTQALPIVCSFRDMEDLRKGTGERLIPFAETTDASIDMLEACSREVGLAKNDMLDRIGETFARWEIPIGMAEKLMGLNSDDYDLLEFLVDDSGSMMGTTDCVINGKKMSSRWEEAKTRLLAMMDILSMIPCPPIVVHFLNRSDTVNLSHTGQTPEAFMADATEKIERAFSVKPRETTPFWESIERSFSDYARKRVVRYFFGDGVPNGGSLAIEKIRKLVINRPNPSKNPVTFLSCSDNDEDVRWMKEVEEEAPYCAEIDDFHAECAEVVGDQGKGLPFSYGFYLICALCAAMNPDDLDAFDESVPITRRNLDNILGVKCTDADYSHYFRLFVEAQQNRPSNSKDPVEHLKKTYDWASHKEAFTMYQGCSTSAMPQVADFKAKLARLF